MAALQVYLDEDVDVLLARLLGVRGFDCVTASGLGNVGWTDERQLEWAAGEERILITHNRMDFEDLARQWWSQCQDHAGIILTVRRVNTHDVLRRVIPVLMRYDQAGWHNVVMYA